MEHLHRYTKLSYRVVFPWELKLFNTVSHQRESVLGEWGYVGLWQVGLLASQHFVVKRLWSSVSPAGPSFNGAPSSNSSLLEPRCIVDLTDHILLHRHAREISLSLVWYHIGNSQPHVHVCSLTLVSSCGVGMLLGEYSPPSSPYRGQYHYLRRRKASVCVCVCLFVCVCMCITCGKHVLQFQLLVHVLRFHCMVLMFVWGDKVLVHFCLQVSLPLYLSLNCHFCIWLHVQYGYMYIYIYRVP